MSENWAAEHLQTIRTLMERSAVYRRALAPVMLLVGILGCVAAVIGWFAHLQSDREFIVFWVVVSAIAIVGAFLLMRRQALRDAEPFWTPPTRRIAEAVTPLFAFGAVVTVIMIIQPAPGKGLAAGFLPPIWMALYGCALHAAGFFTPRGIKWLGWIFIVVGSTLLLSLFAGLSLFEPFHENGHLTMGASFGGLHLAYGVYLYFTENRKNAA